MSKTITVSYETWEKIKETIKAEGEETAPSSNVIRYTKKYLIELLRNDVSEFNRVVRLKLDGGHWEDLPKIRGKLDLSEADLE